MGFDKFKNFWNVDIKDGVQGKAVGAVGQHAAGRSARRHNVMMWLDVYVEGWEPYRVEHHCMVKTSKHPQPGETLPVVVDRENKERIDIQWDEVKTVDELMREAARRDARGGEHGDGPAAGDRPRDAGLSGDLNERIQQAMQIAQQAMQPGAAAGRAAVNSGRETGTSPQLGAPGLAARFRRAERRRVRGREGARCSRAATRLRARRRVSRRPK